MCLLDPTPLEPATWQKLADYAAEGHGVAVFLGRNARPIDSFNGPRRRSCCRASCCVRRGGPTATCGWPRAIFSIRSWRPSAAGQARSLGTPFPCSAIGSSISVARASSVVLPYSDGGPAVFERPVGRGRVLTMTTPVSDRPNQDPWNLLPVGGGREAWPFVILANQMAAYLVGSSEQQLNYLAGQTAVLQLDAGRPAPQLYVVRAGRPSVPYPADLESPRVGHHRDRSRGQLPAPGGRHGGVDLGFSVNYAPDQTRLDRLTDQELRPCSAR